MYLHNENGGECFEDDDNDGLYHPNQQPREQGRVEPEVHTVQNPIREFIHANTTEAIFSPIGAFSAVTNFPLEEQTNDSQL